MECLENIIGLTETNCACVLPEGSDETIDLTTSKSGVYLDRLEGFNLSVASGADSCADGELLQRMNTARQDAILAYRTDMLACIGRFYKPKFNNFTGQLGKSTFKKTVNPGKTFCGMRLSPAFIKGGYITINKVGIIINQAANVSFKIYSNENESTLIYESSPITTTANLVTWAVLSEPLELPMWSDSGHYVKYYVLIEPDGWLPCANKSSCGCGNEKAIAAQYSKWIAFNGTQGNEIDELSTFGTANDLVLNGITVNVDLKCKVSDVICSEQHPLDFLNDGAAMHTAFAIRFKAGAILYSQLISSGEINRFTMLNRDYVINKIKEWNDIYQLYIEETCKNTNRLSDNDCLICKDTQGTILKRSIRV